MFEKCHRTTQSISRFKSTKTLLGSSLDQGLNQPVMQSRDLNNQSKRICKSEESAIDNTALSLPRNMCSMSSDDTLNETIFDKTRDSISKVHSNYNNDETNVSLIESDIEIMVPMSVSKPKVNSDITENPANTRQRSSNSISSCEMALTSSLVDEDSSNGNSSIKNGDNCDGVFVSQEHLKNRTNDKNSSTNQNFDNSSEKSKNEGIDEKCFQKLLSKNGADSSHSFEKVEDCDSKRRKRHDSLEEHLVLLKEHSIQCDTETRYFPFTL